MSFRYLDGSLPRPVPGPCAVVCYYCGYAATANYEMIVHRAQHHHGIRANPDNPLRCRQVPCASLARDYRELVVHLRSHAAFHHVNADQRLTILPATTRSSATLCAGATPLNRVCEQFF